MKKYKKINYEWDLTILAKDELHALSQLEIVEQKVDEFCERWRNNKDYLKNPKVLKDALDEYEELIRNYGFGGNSWYYSSLKFALKQNDPNIKALYNKVEERTTKIVNKLLFFEHSIAYVNEKNQKIFLDDETTREYKHFIEKIFIKSRYLLSEKEEKIINLLSNLAYKNWVNMVEEFISSENPKVKDADGQEKVMTFENLLSNTSNPQKEIRKAAANTLNKIFKKHIKVAEHELNSVLFFKKITDELRGYTRPDQSRHIQDDIDTNVVDTLVKIVSQKYDISRKYYHIKAKLLGLKKLKYYERNLKYQVGSINKTYSYEQAFDLVLSVLAKLDNEFAEIMLTFNDQKLIDVYPKPGKSSGAFCAHNLISQPTYILLNHNNQLKDVLTLAHEIGHGINNELIRKQQNALNFGTPTSTAEVASTFIEDFVLDELLKNVKKEERLELMISKLDEEIATIFRQIALYQFEQELHSNFRKKGYLDSAEIGNLFKNYMQLYLGDAIIFDDNAKNWWLYWSHIRMFFYVYSYASGLLISKALQNSVRRNPQFILKVKKFLSTGLSKTPADIFNEIGIDVTNSTFWLSGLEEIENTIQEIELLAKNLGKL